MYFMNMRYLDGGVIMFNISINERKVIRILWANWVL